MKVVYPICCGLDVHSKKVVACLLRGEKKEIRSYGTLTEEIQALVDWLVERGCEQVAMESTGVYWKPLYNLMEGHFEILLVNAQHIKMVPGRKTDVNDAQWIAELLQHGLLKGSFIPPREIRELRDLTRQRMKLKDRRASLANRVTKVLEDANIKLKSVVSDLQGKSSLLILRELIQREARPEELAEMAKGRLRSKIPILEKALVGRLTSHHRFLLRELLDEMEYLDGAIDRFSQQIEKQLDPHPAAVELLDAIPGIDQTAAQATIAEIGMEMKQFPTAGNLSSWAGICPGQNESAGKHYSGKTRKGNTWLRRILVQCAWAASRKKGSYFKAQYQRLVPRLGKKRAIVAVAHSLLVVIHVVLNKGVFYEDLGADYFEKLNEQQILHQSVKRLQRLGYEVTIEKKAA